MESWFPGGPGQDAESICISAGHRPGRMSCQDCQSVGIYSPDQCPGQDSNLRSRLRRGLLCTPLTRERAAARPARAHIGRSPPNCGAPPRWPPMASHGWRYDTNTPSKCVHQRPAPGRDLPRRAAQHSGGPCRTPRTRANETKIETTRPMALKLVGSVRAHELRGPVASGGTGPAGLAVECADHPPDGCDRYQADFGGGEFQLLVAVVMICCGASLAVRARAASKAAGVSPARAVASVRA